MTQALNEVGTLSSVFVMGNEPPVSAVLSGTVPMTTELNATSISLPTGLSKIYVLTQLPHSE